jgi:hypothetical protein
MRPYRVPDSQWIWDARGPQAPLEAPLMIADTTFLSDYQHEHERRTVGPADVSLPGIGIDV